VVWTLSDRSQSTSSLITAFGNPNSYASNLSEYENGNQPISWRSLKRSHYDGFHALTIDYQTARAYYGNNADGNVEHIRVTDTDNTSTISIFAAPPITKQVMLTVVRAAFLRCTILLAAYR